MMMSLLPRVHLGNMAIVFTGCWVKSAEIPAQWGFTWECPASRNTPAAASSSLLTHPRVAKSRVVPDCSRFSEAQQREQNRLAS